jgi:hypothetical protein
LSRNRESRQRNSKSSWKSNWSQTRFWNGTLRKLQKLFCFETAIDIHDSNLHILTVKTIKNIEMLFLNLIKSSLGLLPNCVFKSKYNQSIT